MMGRLDNPLGGMPETRQPEQVRTRILQIDGRVWTVQELRTRVAGGGQLSLVFQRDGMARRVQDYPADWYLLPDTELEALSWRR